MKEEKMILWFQAVVTSPCCLGTFGRAVRCRRENMAEETANSIADKKLKQRKG